MYSTFEKLMEEKGVNASQVCKHTGIAKSTISDWKAGRSTPKVDKMLKLANYFGVSIETLIS